MYKSKKKKKKKNKKQKKKTNTPPTIETHDRHLYKANTHRTAFQKALRSIPVSRLGMSKIGYFFWHFMLLALLILSLNYAKN